MSDQYVTVTVAGHLTGIPERTIRRWVASGKVPVMAGQRGRLVLLSAVESLATMSGHAPVNVAQSDSAPDTSGHVTGQAPAVVESARAQLEAVRDEWLQPLVDQLTAAHQTIGQLQERLVAAERERDALRRAQETLELDQVVQHVAGLDDAQPPRGRAWWRVWER